MAHEEQQEPRKEVQYPLDSSNSYEIFDEVGNGVRSVVYKAKCFAMEDSTVVAIKAVDLDRSWWWQPKETLLSHPNILNAHCTLIVDQRLWVVMPFMSAGSLQSIISSSCFPDGLSEPCIAIILKETLSALSYLHKQQEVHKGIKASNILIDSNGSVKLTDHFGMSSSSSNNAASGTPYWMAPEILKSQISYREKADIWAFGITALELAHGRPPISYGPKRFSKAFEDMVASCLHKDPRKRPSAETLLNHSFFENCGGSDFLVENVLHGLPSLEERFNESKIHMTSKNGDGDDE